MNLGELITLLEGVDPNLVFPKGFGEPDSWRGVYAEIAFEPAENVSAASMLAHAKSANGARFNGYKGGSYLMGLETPVHIERYGCYSGEDAAITSHRWQLMLMLAQENQQ